MSISIFPNNPLYNYDPKNRYHKKLLEKTGDSVLIIKNYNDIEKYSGNNYGKELMKIREQLTGVKPKETRINNITVEKTERGYIVRGEPDEKLMETIENIKYKLPNGKTIKCIKRKLPKGDGWIIQETCASEEIIEFLKSYIPDNIKLRENARKELLNIAKDYIDDAIMFAGIRESLTIKPVDVLYAVKDLDNRSDLIGSNNFKTVPDDFRFAIMKYIKEKRYNIDDASIKLLYGVSSNFMDSDYEITEEEFIDKFVRLYKDLEKRYPKLSRSKLCIFILDLIIRDNEILKKIKERYSKVNEENEDKEEKEVNNENDIETSHNFEPYSEKDSDSEGVNEVNDEKSVFEEDSNEEFYYTDSDDESQSFESIKSEKKDTKEKITKLKTKPKKVFETLTRSEDSEAEGVTKVSEAEGVTKSNEDNITKYIDELANEVSVANDEKKEKKENPEAKKKIENIWDLKLKKEFKNIDNLDIIFHKLNELNLDEKCKKLILSAVYVLNLEE